MINPFKGLVTEPPHPPVRLTSGEWHAVGTQPVYLSDLYLTQSLIYVLALFEPASSEFPRVVAWDGELYLDNGHIRVLREGLAGTRVMRMRVYRPTVAEQDAP